MRSLEQFYPKDRCDVKFVKIGPEVIISGKVGISREPDHGTLIPKKITTLEQLRRERPTSLDGGYLTFLPSVKEITIDRNSGTLNLPVEGHEEAAREKTVRRVQEIFPGWTINEPATGKLMPGEVSQDGVNLSEYL